MIHHSVISFNAHATYPAVSRAMLTRNSPTCPDHTQSLRWQYVGSPRGRLSSPSFLRRCTTHDDLGYGRGKGTNNVFHEMELEVREYEVDLHGFVKDSVYANYCHYCCRKFLDMTGVCVTTEVDLAGKSMAFTNMSIKIHSHLRNRVKFVMRTRIYEVSAVRMLYEFFIFERCSEKLLVEAKTTVICVDQRHLRPVRIPLVVRSKIDRFISGGEQRND